jgi:hypothetical protein
MQYHAIGSLGNMRVALLKKAQEDTCEVQRREAKAKKSERFLAWCEPALQWIAGAYLAEALILSFLVYAPC